MKINKNRLATAIATGAVLLNALAPITFASTTIEISGNGTQSNNDTNVSASQTTSVVQSNNADINNYVDASADTGNNDAKNNTGGDVMVSTGDAKTDVGITNVANSNTASVDCCNNNDTSVLVSGNGSKSDNTVNLDSASSNSIFQDNNADVTNTVNASSDTGDNNAKDNTGGDVTVETGDAKTMVDLNTTANRNSAQIGGGNQNSGSVSLRILGNGTNSNNDITLGLSNDTAIVQSNNAEVNNNVNADADTGNNDAKNNTGGDVMVSTGDAKTDVNVDTAVNFNWAAADCGCLLNDLLVKIAGNGSDTDNTIKADLGSSLEVFQDNCGNGEWWWWNNCGVNNKVNADSDTGDNNAKNNTGGVQGGDPSVDTGDATTNVDTSNSGNVNVFGNAPDTLGFPDFNFNLDFSLNFSDFWAWLMSQA